MVASQPVLLFLLLLMVPVVLHLLERFAFLLLESLRSVEELRFGGFPKLCGLVLVRGDGTVEVLGRVLLLGLLPRREVWMLGCGLLW